MKKLILITLITFVRISFVGAQEFTGEGVEVSQSDPIVSKKNY